VIYKNWSKIEYRGVLDRVKVLSRPKPYFYDTVHLANRRIDVLIIGKGDGRKKRV